MDSWATQTTYLDVNIPCIDHSTQTYLINVQVGAIMVQLRVVVVKRGEINAMGLGHLFASVIRFNLIDLLAVLVNLCQAQFFVRHEVRAFRVDLRIQNKELIPTTRSAFRRNVTRGRVRTGQRFQPGKSNHKSHPTGRCANACTNERELRSFCNENGIQVKKKSLGSSPDVAVEERTRATKEERRMVRE